MRRVIARNSGQFEEERRSRRQSGVEAREVSFEQIVHQGLKSAALQLLAHRNPVSATLLLIPVEGIFDPVRGIATGAGRDANDITFVRCDRDEEPVLD